MQNIKQLYFLIFFIIIYFLLVTISVSGQNKIIISAFGDPKEPVNLMAEYVMREAYKKLNLNLQLNYLPGLRALKSANDGETDGDLVRIKGIEKEYPNLRRIPVSIVSVEFVVFTRKIFFKVSGWESLKPYTIGYLRGLKIVEIKTRGMMTESVDSEELAFSKLNLGRTDIVVDPRYMGIVTLNKLKLKNITILDPPLEIIPLYHYINKKHQALILQLNSILEDMAHNGRIEKLTKKALKESLK